MCRAAARTLAARRNYPENLADIQEISPGAVCLLD
jgi:hypothetical protein